MVIISSGFVYNWFKKQWAKLKKDKLRKNIKSLLKWFYAIYIFISHKKGISSIQLAKDINVTQKSAWFMLNRIRYNMYDRMKPAFEDMTQVDETYVGGRNKGRIKGAQGRSLKTKVPVVGLLMI